MVGAPGGEGEQKGVAVAHYLLCASFAWPLWGGEGAVMLGARARPADQG